MCNDVQIWACDVFAYHRAAILDITKDRPIHGHLLFEKNCCLLFMQTMAQQYRPAGWLVLWSNRRAAVKCGNVQWQHRLDKSSGNSV